MSNIKTVNKEKNYQETPAFISKTKEDFKSELFKFARTNFSDQIEDFSDASLGGMLLDFAAIIGESLTYYVDSQINELNYETASTEYSILNHLKRANINSGYASPSSVFIDFIVTVPADSNDTKKPDVNYLPVIQKETVLESIEGIKFILAEDVDFTKYLRRNVLRSITSTNGSITDYIISMKGIAISGEITSETFTFDEFDINSFLSYTLSNQDITQVISVVDSSSNRNIYKEVEFLSQDTVYEKVEIGKNNFFNVKPAPFRYILERNFDDGLTTIRFGNGKNKILEDGIFTNPEDLMLPFLGKEETFAKALDPKDLINSPSLGISPAGKTITVKYKFGGGIDHNVSANSISTIENLIYKFPNLETNLDFKVDKLISSISVNNSQRAVGGTNALTLEELKNLIPTTLKMQTRIVTHEDLLARIYSMPSNFGKIHKVAILDNPYTKISKDLIIVCKDEFDNYIRANDALKYNLSNYLNEYRLLGDTFNIVDADIYNIGIDLKIKVSSSYDPEIVLSDVRSRIIVQMRLETLQIGQGINVNDIISIALNTPGVLTVSSDYKNVIRSKGVEDLNRINLNDTDRSYSNNQFSVYDYYDSGIVYPPRAGIFELKYTDDIEIING